MFQYSVLENTELHAVSEHEDPPLSMSAELRHATGRLQAGENAQQPQTDRKGSSARVFPSGHVNVMPDSRNYLNDR